MFPGKLSFRPMHNCSQLHTIFRLESSTLPAQIMKTGVLVHGCNLNIENWRHVAWGDPPNLLGRIPQGVLAALAFDAEVIVFGTGASKKVFRLGESEKTGQELAEAEYSLEYLKLHFANLGRFEPLKKRGAGSDVDSISAMRESILKRIILDLDSRNTYEEITNAGEIFLKHNVERVVLVSSPSHIVRCLRDASSIYQTGDRFKPFRYDVYASPSITCYEGTTADDVVVIEPPHRPDRHVVPTHRRIQRMLTLQKLDETQLIKLIEEFDDLLQRYEHKFFNEGS